MAGLDSIVHQSPVQSTRCPSEKVTIEDKAKREKVTRVRDGDRVRYFTDFLNNYAFPLILQVRERYDTTQINELVDRLTDVGNKSSSDEYKNMVRCLHEDRKSKRRETSAEMTKIGMYVSALMAGSI